MLPCWIFERLGKTVGSGPGDIQPSLSACDYLLTAYDDHLMDAFQVNAQGYLLKPIRKEALITAIEKATRVTQAQLNRFARRSVPD